MESCNAMHGSDYSPQHIAQIALLGAIGAGGGALACAKIPSFGQLAEKLHQQLTRTTTLCSEVPGLSLIVKDNPLLNNDLITKFLCISALETGVMAAGTVGVGAVMKATGFTSLCLNHYESGPRSH